MASLIIPAAGKGIRVGSPESKEMLPDPSGEPLIAWSLKLAKEYHCDPVVISRKEKSSLNAYLMGKSIQPFFAEESKEWPDSVLQSKQLWSDKNILILPDTRFAPTIVIKKMLAALNEEIPIAFALHKVTDPQNWGIVDCQGKAVRVCEKPKQFDINTAWGLIAFRKSAGESLLVDILTSALTHQWFELSQNCQNFDLEDFEDLTRP